MGVFGQIFAIMAICIVTAILPYDSSTPQRIMPKAEGNRQYFRSFSNGTLNSTNMKTSSNITRYSSNVTRSKTASNVSWTSANTTVSSTSNSTSNIKPNIFANFSASKGNVSIKPNSSAHATFDGKRNTNSSDFNVPTKPKSTTIKSNSSKLDL